MHGIYYCVKFVLFVTALSFTKFLLGWRARHGGHGRSCNRRVVLYVLLLNRVVCSASHSQNLTLKQLLWMHVSQSLNTNAHFADRFSTRFEPLPAKNLALQAPVATRKLTSV